MSDTTINLRPHPTQPVVDCQMSYNTNVAKIQTSKSDVLFKPPFFNLIFKIRSTLNTCRQAPTIAVISRETRSALRGLCVLRVLNKKKVRLPLTCLPFPSFRQKYQNASPAWPPHPNKCVCVAVNTKGRLTIFLFKLEIKVQIVELVSVLIFFALLLYF